MYCCSTWIWGFLDLAWAKWFGWSPKSLCWDSACAWWVDSAELTVLGKSTRPKPVRQHRISECLCLDMRCNWYIREMRSFCCEISQLKLEMTEFWQIGIGDGLCMLVSWLTGSFFSSHLWPSRVCSKLVIGYWIQVEMYGLHKSLSGSSCSFQYNSLQWPAVTWRHLQSKCAS